MSPYHIEKDTIQETLVIPLYGRALCARRFPHLFADETAAELLEQIDYNFSALEQKSGGLIQTFGALEAAMRQSDLAFEVREYLRAHPRAAVVNLGCGLDHTGRACDNGTCRIYNLDLPDVMAVREALLPAGERERNLAADLNDLAWFDAIDTPAEDGAVFLRKIGHHEVGHPDGLILFDDCIDVFHHIRQRDMGAEGDQPGFPQGVPDVFRLQTIGAGQFYSLIAEFPDLLHHRCKLVGGILQQIPQAKHLNSDR